MIDATTMDNLSGVALPAAVGGFLPPRQAREQPLQTEMYRSQAAPFAYAVYSPSFAPPPPAPVARVPQPAKALDAGEDDGYRSESWTASSSGSCSDHSPPPSQPNDWDLLSEMLLDDALTSATSAGLVPPPPAMRQQPLQFHPQIHFQPNWQSQQQQFRQFEAPMVDMRPMLAQLQPPMVAAGSPPGVMAAMEAAPHPASAKISPAQRPRPTVTATRQRKQQAATMARGARSAVATPRRGPSKDNHDSPSASSTASSSGSPVVNPAASTVSTNSLTESNLSPEELKKLRRRNQIASSVQRHREKKKCVVSALKLELSELTTQLEELRAQRKGMHADARLVEWEETAVTQRRKRKQSEELNERMKKALFQQTAFLMGMRGLLSGPGEPLGPSEMEFHDWIHSYTILSARGQEARRREIVSVFSESKMDLAKKLVLRETDPVMTRVNRSQPYYATTKVLHDGTRQFVEEPDADPYVVKREINSLRSSMSEETMGDGRVLKKFTSIFLFEESIAGSLERLHDLVFESSKGVGIYWPAAGYSSRAFDQTPVPSANASNVIYADMTASMAVMDDLRVKQEGEEDINVEARVLCREMKDEHEGIIVWDYVDRDDLTSEQTPPPSGRAIRRNCCGAIVIRREPGGLMSVRSISVKMFAPDGDALKPKVVEAPTDKTDDEEERLLTLFRRIGLQATEVERSQERCTHYVYEALQQALS